MTSTVPFIYIPLIALICYVLMLTAFLAAKKTQVIRSFMLCIVGFMLWTGGSLFMRMQMWPGAFFWYEVSILALFTLALLYYDFVLQFAKAKDFLIRVVWTIGTGIILFLTHFEVFLKRPEIVTRANGTTIFVYTMEWQIAIPSVFFACIVVSIVRILLRLIKNDGIQAPGIKAIVAGCLIMLVGNVISIVPNNIFPWDTLAGILNAFCLMYALYKKRMFRLKLLVSKSTMVLISAVVVALVTSPFIEPIETFLVNNVPDIGENLTLFVALCFSLLTAILYTLVKKVIDRIFVREELQGQALERFSATVAQTLKTHEILKELVNVVISEIRVDRVYVCMLQDGRYKAQISSNALDSTSFYLMEDNPCISQLRAGEACVILSDFKSNTMYKSMWETEKELLESLNIGCIVGIKNGQDIIGLILLKNKPKNAAFTYDDTSFLGTVASIVSIALKNAGLYEQVYRESRIDSMTGLYNYKYFSERIEEEFAKAGDRALSLLFIDVDDFKLFNQLYGIDAGDAVLKQIASVLTAAAGGLGIVCRFSGKVFAVILPGGEPRQAYQLAMRIKKQIAGLNKTPERSKYKTVTVSCGICAYPYAASNPRELTDNADLAVYHAKNSGKNQVAIYSSERKESSRPLTDEPSAYLPAAVADGATGYAAHASIISALTAAVHAKDHYTFDHSQNVARYATILATAIGMNQEHIRILYEAALLHDIGKISIPENILRKTSKLDKDEYEIMKGHVNSSIDMIRHLPSMDYVIPAAIGHHERWDGKGYPRGIAREEIPIAARCLAIADAFDAMTATRPYRSAMTVELATEQIESNAGTQFDPELAGIFTELVRSKKITLNVELR